MKIKKTILSEGWEEDEDIIICSDGIKTYAILCLKWDVGMIDITAYHGDLNSRKGIFDFVHSATHEHNKYFHGNNEAAESDLCLNIPDYFTLVGKYCDGEEDGRMGNAYRLDDNRIFCEGCNDDYPEVKIIDLNDEAMLKKWQIQYRKNKKPPEG